MPTSPDADSHGLPADEVTRRLNELGIEAGELHRLERAARLFERLEWRIAREQAADTGPFTDD